MQRGRARPAGGRLPPAGDGAAHRRRPGGAPGGRAPAAHGGPGHRVGRGLGAGRWLRPGGPLVAHLDPAAIRWADGAPAGRFALAALRAEGFAYSARHHRLTLTGPRTVRLPLHYVGADPDAGPNYTGQPGVAAHYRRAG
ncbi:hypothetical protein [Actinacidiphila glaucinigra]